MTVNRTTVAMSGKTHQDLVLIAAELTLRNGERCSMDRAIYECIKAYRKRK